ncbi:ATP-binding cassette, subfamily B [Reichenbachiella faecimaris]|uniref:Multidrug resistance-like ATP-binding protein MdlB n=2 Tax=Reichenbachiella faecimaris TaxID=692418 RepID=A0A1W2GHL2_REIFA|nr:ATP-binding cassette, subfamily B [Reichenbachiella faecimaris]
MMECGTTSLAMIFRYYGLYNIKTLLAEIGKVSTQGTNLYMLSEIAKQFGFESDGYKMDGFKHFKKISLPCIAHYEGNHFVVIYKINETHIWVADPAYGKYKLKQEEFRKKWNGIIMTIEPTREIFENKDMMDLVKSFRHKKNTIAKNFYTSLLHPFKSILIEIFAASFILQLLGLALPFFAQGIIDKVLSYNDRKLLFAILVGMLGVFLSQIIFTYARNMLLTKLKIKIELIFFSKFFNHFINLAQTFFDMHKRQDFIQRFQENLKIRRLLAPSILQTFIDLLFVIIYIGVLFFYNGVLAITSLIFVTLYGIMMLKFTPTLMNLENRAFNENLKAMGSFLDTLLGIQTIKLLNIEKLKFWSWKNDYKKALNKALETEKMHIKLGTILKAFYYLSHIVIYWVGAYMAVDENISIGQYVAFIAIFTMVMNSLNNTSTLWFVFTELSTTYARLNDILLQDPEPNNILGTHKDINNITIQLKNIDFAYDENLRHKVINGINMTIEKGKHIGLVGRNGSGKSTLVKLLVGLYQNYNGEILFNNVELRHIYIPELRKKIYLFPQEVSLFDTTIKENIQYGNLEAGMEDIIEAAKLAGIHEFIRNNYLGYNLRIGENGVNLSGGQKLKIAFARLFLANPEVIILDEASSALDVESEKTIMKNIYKHFKGKTIISIAHRMNTLTQADTLYVIDEGTFKEVGSHKDLMEKKGIYFDFIKTYLDI